MRGFRGSRAALNNLSARHGQGHAYAQFKSGIPYYPNQQDKQGQRPPLPDWMKTPETRAKEQLEAHGQRNQRTGQQARITPAQAHTQAQAKSKAPLRVVASQPASHATTSARQQPQLQMIKGGAKATATATAVAKPKAAAKKAASAKPAAKKTAAAKPAAKKAKPRTATAARKAAPAKRKAA